MPTTTYVPTVGERLQHRRLEVRVHRLERVVAALEDRRRLQEALALPDR